MIRDPSDGTVREAPKDEASKLRAPTTGNIPAIPDTGLRQPTRSDAQERLEESRTWLKTYFAKKEREHAGADIEQAANGSLRASSAGPEQQGDRHKAGD